MKELSSCMKSKSYLLSLYELYGREAADQGPSQSLHSWMQMSEAPPVFLELKVIVQHCPFT